MTFFTKHYHAPGTPPGTLVDTATNEASPIQLRLIDDGPEQVVLRDDLPISEYGSYLDDESVTWVHAQGRASPYVLRELCEVFNWGERKIRSGCITRRPFLRSQKKQGVTGTGYFLQDDALRSLSRQRFGGSSRASWIFDILLLIPIPFCAD